MSIAAISPPPLSPVHFDFIRLIRGTGCAPYLQNCSNSQPALTASSLCRSRVQEISAFIDQLRGQAFVSHFRGLDPIRSGVLMQYGNTASSTYQMTSLVHLQSHTGLLRDGFVKLKYSRILSSVGKDPEMR